MTPEEYHQTLADMAADKIPKGARGAAMKAIDDYEASNKPEPGTEVSHRQLPFGRELNLHPAATPFEQSIEPVLASRAAAHSTPQQSKDDYLKGQLSAPPMVSKEEEATPLEQQYQDPRSQEEKAAAQTAAGPGAHLPPLTQEENIHHKIRSMGLPPVHKDPKLASASQSVDLYAPPEFMPTDLADRQPLAPMPSTFGGQVEHYVEPGLSQFQRDMASAYGPERIRGMTEDSPEFQEYADAQWKSIYDQAKKDGTPVVRMKFAADPKWREQSTGDKLFYGGMNALAQVGTAADAAVDTATLGIGTRLLGNRENAQKLASANPIAARVGSVAGAINPYGAGGLAARGVGKAIGPLADIPVMGAAVQQGAGAAATVAGEEGVSRLAGEQGDPEWGTRALTAGGLAALFGGITDVPGRLAEKATRTIRLERPDLPEAERIGGQTSFTKGFKEGPDVTQLRRDLPYDVTPIGHASEVVGDKLVAQANATTDATKQAIERDVQSYYAATKDVREPSTELLHDAMRQHAARTDDMGRDIDERANPGFRKLIAGISDVKAVPGDANAALRAAQGEAGGARSLDGNAAKRAGLDVPGAIQRWAQQNQIPPDQVALAQPEDFTFVVTPRKYSPQQWDEKVDAIDREARVDSKAGPRDPAMNSFLRSARQVRDRFPAVGPAADKYYALDDGTVVEGWSALKQEHADLTQGTQDQLAAGGLRNPPGARPDLQDATAAANAVKAYGEGGHLHPRTTQLLKQAADEAGTGRELRDVRGLYATERLKRGPGTTETVGLHGLNPFETLRAGNVRMRLDPMLSTIGLPSGERSTEAGYRPDRGALQNPFRLRGGAPGRAAVAFERRKGENTLSPEEATMLQRAIMMGAF